MPVELEEFKNGFYTISYLELLLTRFANRGIMMIYTEWNRKQYDSGTVLKFFLYHANETKEAITANMLKNAILYSSDAKIKDSIDKWSVIMSANDYPSWWTVQTAWKVILNGLANIRSDKAYQRVKSHISSKYDE